MSASDADGETISWSTTNLPSFCNLAAATGTSNTLQCNPGFTDAGTYNNVTITVSDGNVADNDSETITITVGATNQPPVLSPIGNQSVAEGATLNEPLSASDADGETISWSTTNLPSFCNLAAARVRVIRCSATPGSPMPVLTTT